MGVGTMKSLIFADIHSNLAALEAMLDNEGDFDEIIFLGDAVIGGPQPDEVLSLLSKLKGFFLMGNHDAEVLKVDLEKVETNPNRIWIQWTRKHISPENIEFIKTFVNEPCSIERQGLSFSLTHGCLPRELGHRLWPDSESEIFDGLAKLHPSPHILIGHSHVQFIRQHKNTTVINPGGLGQPRLGQPLACYVVLEDGEIKFKAVKYDSEKTCKAIDSVPLDKDFIDQWKHCYRVGILPSMYKIRNFESLMKLGYR
jgi:putative phosphoesterase